MTKVILYSTSTCSNCQIVKKVFETYGVSFEEKLIDKNPEFNEEFTLITEGHRFVPTIVVSDSVYVNIKPHEVVELIKKLILNT